MKLTRREALLGGASVLAVPYISRASDFFTMQRQQQGLRYGTKRTSLVFMGASVNWGLGNDQTQTYAYYLQQMIDARLSTPLGGWVARYVHQDDIRPGDGTGTFPSDSAPFNANSSSEGPNYGTGIFSSSTPFLWSNAGGSLTCCAAPTNLNPTIGGVIGTAKLNSTAAPTQGNAGIFSAYSGTKTAPGGAYGPYTNPALRLDTTGQFIRFAANGPTFLIIGLVGNSAVDIYSTYTGGSNPITITNTSTTGITMYNVNLALGSGSSGGGIAYPVTPWTVTGSGMVGLSVYRHSATGVPVDVSVLWPTRAQTTNHIAVQICSRDSYCLQDYTNSGSAILDTATGSPTYGTHAKLPDLISQGIINSPSLAPSVAAAPIYVIMDSYNSIVTPGRQLTPAQYSTYLGQLASDLVASSTGNGGSVVLTMAVPPTSVSGYGPPGGSDWHDYAAAMRTLAKSNSWGFIDQSVIPSLPTVYANGNALSSFYPDNIHPNTVLTKQIARLFIDALGL